MTDADPDVPAAPGEAGAGDADSDVDDDRGAGADPGRDGSADPGRDGSADPGRDGSADASRDEGADRSLVVDVEMDWGADGRVPAVAQDADTGEVLMLAYVTPEALDRTLETGRAHYYSRSRSELWEKGATSGHVQRVREVRVDCDGDALLYRVEQEGGACHTGHRSCFHRTLDGEAVGRQVFDPEAVYGG